MTRVSRTYVTHAGLRIDALRDVSLRIDAGELVAVMAPSGAGKSTLLHVLGAMDQPDGGRIVVAGEEVTAMPPKQLVRYRRTVGFVFQRFHLLPALNALDNVIAPVMPYRTGFDKPARAQELLELVGLGDRGDSIPARLSGGQQQRVAIARALINHPRLLLADEPTGNLDTATGAEVMDLLVDVAAEQGTTMVLATHDPTVASRCRRVIKLRDGRIEAGDVGGAGDGRRHCARGSRPRGDAGG
jgi:putative ABC transport system ATP-binding protein